MTTTIAPTSSTHTKYDEKAWKVEFQEDFDPDERNSYAYSFVKFVRELKT